MTKLNKKPLIIWDFDGVIADSEALWIGVWRDVLKKEKNISLTKKEELKLLVGVADRTKKHHLQKYFPNITFDADFMKKISEGETYAGDHFMKTIPGVEKIFADKNFNHCIATGGTMEQHLWKMSIFPWIKKYIKPSDYFTVDMVEHGKPAPDLFLLAAQKEGYDPQNCVVIEDSIHGMNAAKAAKIKCIAFVGAQGNNTKAYKQKCLKTGVIAICETMPELHHALRNCFNLKLSD